MAGQGSPYIKLGDGGGAAAAAAAVPAPAAAPAAMAGPSVRSWTPAKTALYLLVIAFIVSEYYFYLFTQPVTESEARNFLGLGKAAALYLSNVLAADDSVTCSLVGANVDGTLTKAEKFLDLYKSADAKQRRAIIAMGILLVVGWFIGSCSVLVGLKPKTPKDWAFGAFLVFAQMALYICGGIANAVIAVLLLEEFKRARKTTARAAIADEGTALLSAAAPTTGALTSSSSASRFSELVYQTAEGSQATIPALKFSWNSMYILIEMIRTLVGLPIRGATFGFTGQKAMELLTDNPIATGIAAGIGALTGTAVQALTIAPMSVEAALRKQRLRQMSVAELTAFISSTPQKDWSLEVTKLWELAPGVLADKKAGILRTTAASILPMVLWDAKSQVVGGIVLFFAIGGLINRFLDNSGFTVNFLGNGVAQRFPIAVIALLAAAQWFTANYVFGRDAANAVINDARALLTTASASSCCRRTGRPALSGLGSPSDTDAFLPAAGAIAPSR